MTLPLNSLTALVDRIIVITIAAATDRQAHITALLDRAGLPFEFHFGRDCREASVSDLVASGEYDAGRRRRSGRPEMTAGEIGCALSHRDVARKVAGGPHERVLILEDDICIIEENVEHLGKDIQTEPVSWNLGYFGYEAMNLSIPFPIRIKLLSYYPLRYVLGSRRHDPRTISRIYRRPLNSHWMRAGSFNNAHAYAVDRKAAAYIADSQPRIFCESDVFLNHLVRFSGLGAVCLKYPVFGQRPDVTSTIGDRPSWRGAE